MKILHLCYSDTEGGAARAAYRLHLALLKKDAESIMLVQTKSSGNYTVIGPGNTLGRLKVIIRFLLDSLRVRIYRGRNKTLFSAPWLPSAGLMKQIKRLNPDIVHLHWVHFGMLALKDLKKITAPIVWTMHDNWVFTGGCHIKWDCKKFTRQCGACPVLGSHRENDLSRKTFMKKRRFFSKKNNIAFVGVSRWMANEARNSTLLKGADIFHLPNTIDTRAYKMIDQQTSRALWNLNPNNKLILFGAFDAINDINKGFHLLREACSFLPDQNVELVIFGCSEPKQKIEGRTKMTFVGRVVDDTSLATLYSAANVVVVPSLQENLSNCILEAIACCTPVVAFDVGGSSDLVDHKKNGYLARPFDTKDLASGIEWILSSENTHSLNKAARQKAVDTFDYEVVATQYLQLYTSILSKRNLP